VYSHNESSFPPGLGCRDHYTNSNITSRQHSTFYLKQRVNVLAILVVVAEIVLLHESQRRKEEDERRRRGGRRATQDTVVPSDECAYQHACG